MKYLLIVFLIIPAITYGQEINDSSGAYYTGNTYIYKFGAPENWILDLENAYEDGYTAALYPDSNSYTFADMIIYIWVFKRDSLSFEDFISQDSAYYLKEDIHLKFSRSIREFVTPDRIPSVTLEVDDPGAFVTIAFVTYLDLKSEIVIYEAHISDRMYYAEMESKLREAIESLGIIEEKTD